MQQLNEGLRSGDLRNYVSEVFTVDRYSSKMGEDQDVVVLGFRVREKNPAIDMMEFIEKGYPFIEKFRLFRKEHDMDIKFQSLQSKRVQI